MPTASSSMASAGRRAAAVSPAPRSGARPCCRKRCVRLPGSRKRRPPMRRSSSDSIAPSSARLSTYLPRRSNTRGLVSMKTMLASSERLAHDDARSSQPCPRARLGGARFDVAVDHGPDEFARRWARTASQATVFQTEAWLWAWYATIGPAVGEPLLLSAIDHRGELAAMLPLVRRTAGRLRIAEFADYCVSDSNAPVLGPAAPTNAADAIGMWAAV